MRYLAPPSSRSPNLLLTNQHLTNLRPKKPHWRNLQRPSLRRKKPLWRNLQRRSLRWRAGPKVWSTLSLWVRAGWRAAADGAVVVAAVGAPQLTRADWTKPH